ncbi:hypothetical protein RBE51_20720 [Pseudomonas taiwanensis]|uniref:hypothetical protein n=1 Tax=Pseudomonas taiwanensis TaxID=470150 RepID=UPI0028DE2863|nr:hypothetical protein [Pseudomonas taiwanensis]MDT8925220.1 hypothetical protein [Pseudomonas taiwanensis]
MTPEEFETFVRDRASLGWSRQRVCQTLGITPVKLAHLTEGMDGIPWPKPSCGAGHRLHYESIKGQFPLYLQRNIEKALAANAKKSPQYTLCGVRGSVRELFVAWSDYIDVSLCTVRRRLAAGKSLYDALFLPATPLNSRNQGRRRIPTYRKLRRIRPKQAAIAETTNAI